MNAADANEVGVPPLTGLRVLDLTTARAGPTCVRQLADLGADVIQVADPVQHVWRSSDVHNLHRDKRSIIVNLKADRGRDVFLRLVERADIVVENFRPAVKHRLGIDPESVWKHNPRLVYGSISAFGQTGPYAHRRGYDQIAQGLAGLMSVTGPPGSGPWRAGIAIADTAAGTFLTQGILAALLARERSGRGQWVHTSLLEVLVNMMDFQAERWLIDGEIPGQAGNAHPMISWMGTFRTADGYLNVGGTGGWDELLAAIGHDETAGQSPDDAQAAFEAALATRPTAEWMEILLAADVACGPVLAIDEVFADPQVRHLQMTRTVEHITDGPVELLRLPLNFSDAPAAIRAAAPLPGQHSREILTEHGYRGNEIDELLGDNTVMALGATERPRP